MGTADCCGFSSNEKVWLQPQPHMHCSSWLCHAGLFGLLHKIYTSTRHSCDSNTATNLHSTIHQLTVAMSILQSIIHSINGKIDYLIKTSDNLNTKLTSVIGTLHDFDTTLKEWAQSLTNFSKVEQCVHNSMLEFMSHFSNSVKCAF